MRLWTINFKYLDAKGLVALWREALLAKNVLEGLTKGYKNHPQLIRFYTHQNSIDAINAYLLEVYKEACARGYKLVDINLMLQRLVNLTQKIYPRSPLLEAKSSMNLASCKKN